MEKLEEMLETQVSLLANNMGSDLTEVRDNIQALLRSIMYTGDLNDTVKDLITDKLQFCVDQSKSADDIKQNLILISRAISVFSDFSIE